jgi:cytoplasmic iron level regulating protein YaaA (DUF328/UPF0246 family)
VLVLLPPSEGKTAPRRGAPVDLGALAFAAELEERRRAVLAALPDGDALLTAPAARAATVYTGVLFGRLRLPELPARARRRVLIFSGLWGVLRPDDRIPAYKLPIGEKVSGIGPLAAWWRPALGELLPDRGLVLDLRSAAYAAAWRPARATVVAVRGFTERPDGSRTVISHMAKRVRGDVARAVLEAGGRPRGAADVLAIVQAAGMRAEVGEGGATVDVIEAGA